VRRSTLARIAPASHHLSFATQGSFGPLASLIDLSQA
jgi:hypothetical protein